MRSPKIAKAAQTSDVPVVVPVAVAGSGLTLVAIKELVTDGNLDCTDEGIVSCRKLATRRRDADSQALQAMDNSHVALVSLKLVAEQFESYRCDRNMPLGVNVILFSLIRLQS